MATENEELFIERNKDFVIKLKLVGSEGDSNKIRRVRLPRIVKGGKISHKELVGLAIQCKFPHPTSGKNYQVTLTYCDVDNDIVIIGCNEELVDAIEQFTQQRILRIAADVKESEAESAAAAHYVPSNVEDGATGTSTAASLNSKSFGSAEEDSCFGPRQLRNAIRLFADAMDPRNTPLTPEWPATPNHESVTGISTPAPELVPVPDTKARAENPADTALDTNLSSGGVGGASSLGEKTPNDGEFSPDVLEEPAAQESDPKTEYHEQARPFIHGRHTCNGCCCTPIIGKRFHATNMLDYDLCEACREHYNGDEIKFEVVELDRDKKFQDRWNRRRANWDRQRMQTIFRSAGFQANWNAFSRLAVPRDDNEEDLQEAIRRSLEDEAKTTADQAVTKSTASSEPGHTEAQEEKKLSEVAKAPAAEQKLAPKDETAQQPEDEPDGHTEQPVDLPAVEIDIEEPAEPVEVGLEETTVQLEVKSGGENESVACMAVATAVKPNKGDTEAKESHAPAEDPSLEDTADGTAQEEPNPTSENAGGTVQEAPNELGNTFDERKNDILEMISELERQHEQGTPSIVGTVSSDPGVDLAHLDISQQTDHPADDKGSDKVPGDTEKTFDECKTEIDAMVSESEARNVAETTESAPKADNASCDEVSEDEWQVVQNNDKPAAAAAATHIAQASFPDFHVAAGDDASGVDVACASSDRSVSSAESISSGTPFISGESHISAALMGRWGYQLQELRELGFYNEAASIEVLERLSAADIGVGSSDEVTVTRVVNELLKHA